MSDGIEETDYRRQALSMPSPLTREQVEMQVLLCAGPHSSQVRDSAMSIILDHDAAIRLTLAQHAQEIERLTKERDLLLQENMNRRTTLGDLAHEMQNITKHLAAITMERDAVTKQGAIQKEVADNQTWHVQDLREQLATAQNRVKELEEARVQWKTEWRSKTQEANISIADLRDTLASREARLLVVEKACGIVEESNAKLAANLTAAEQRAERAEARVREMEWKA